MAAQRLIRVLCDHCKKAYIPSNVYLKASVSLRIIKEHIYKATGCDCFHTGYRGRGIFEIMVMTEKNLILKTYDSNQIQSEARREKMMSWAFIFQNNPAPLYGLCLCPLPCAPLLLL